MGEKHSTSAPGEIHFHTTSWTVVREAGGAAGTQAARAAQEELCRSYLRPVRALLRARGLSRQDAEDITQEFFQRILSGDRLARLNEDGARFRVWLRRGLENHCISHHRHRRAAKRGAGAEHVEIEDHHVPAGKAQQDASIAQALAFDRAWAATVIDSAVTMLRRRYELDGQARLFEILAPCIDPASEQELGPVVAAELSVDQPAARKTIERFRRRFRDAIRHRVSLTVALPGEVEDEMRYLRQVLSSK